MKNTTVSTEQFGVHLMFDGYGADPFKLKDADSLSKMLHNIPTAMGMHTISDPLVVEVGPKNRKDPGGLSGFVLIAESHLSFHTFPNRGFVTVDLYTCQNDLDSDKLIKELVEAFSVKNFESFIQKRGTMYPTENIIKD